MVVLAATPTEAQHAGSNICDPDILTWHLANSPDSSTFPLAPIRLRSRD